MVALTEQYSSGNFAEQLILARSVGGAFRLQRRFVVRLSGGDAFRYLNGQVTRDLSRLTSGEALNACLLTPRGKLCAPLLIHWEDGDLLVETDSMLGESLLARLDRYIVADDVILSVEPIKEVIHLFGEAASDKHWEHVPGLRTTRLNCAGLDLLEERLAEATLPSLIDPSVIETLRIEQGIPIWGRELTVDTLPPEVGLERTHIDYDRGCYPGQEVISRLKSIGRVNRLLHRVISEPGDLLCAEMTIHKDGGDKIGFISSASPQFDTGSWVGLAVLPRGVSITSEGSGIIFALDPLTGEKTPISISEITGS